MGLSVDSTRFAVQAWQAGVRFDRTLALGHQHMMVGPERIEALLQEHGAWPPPGGEQALHAALRGNGWRFAEFLRALGAQQVDSVDASPYEGATLVHDLNQPIPAEWESHYDVVVDGGTLEHVFNFPVAISNCMRLVKPGGHLLLLTPTNNYCGHGFYQFSPELLFRILSRENGYEVRRMVALQDGAAESSLFGVKYPYCFGGDWHEVKDPAAIRQRVNLVSTLPTLLMVLARRTEAVMPFKTTPQQSDYVTQWQEGDVKPPNAQPAAAGGLEAWLRGRFSETFCRETLPRLAFLLDPFRLWRFRRQFSFANRDCFRPVDKAASPSASKPPASGQQ